MEHPNSVVIVLGTLRFAPANMAAILPHLRKLVESTRRLDGAIAYDVAEDMFDPGLIRFSEIWPDAQALAAHLSAPHIAPWRTIATDLGVHDRSFVAYGAGRSWPV